jgi:hypothetical protein
MPVKGMGKKTIAFISILLIIGIGLVLGVWYLHNIAKKFSGPPESPILGVSPLRTPKQA